MASAPSPVPFLATTAIEEFWDTSGRIVFLGEWCKRYSRRSHWATLDFVDAPDVWPDSDAVLRGIDYCRPVFDEALAAVARELNRLHGLDRDIEYWRMVLGVWLLHFIHQAYDKYQSLAAAFAAHGDLRTLVPDEGSFRVPRTTGDFIHALVRDRYALQLYGRILHASGKAFPERPLEEERPRKLHAPRFRTRVVRAAERLLAAASRVRRRRLLITQFSSIYSGGYQTLRLLAKGRLAFLQRDTSVALPVTRACDPALRKGLSAGLEGDGFRRMLAGVLFQEMPVCFLEGFEEFRKGVLALRIGPADAVLANAAGTGFNSDVLRLYLAETRGRCRILDAVHGAGYGLDQVHVLEELERQLADVFYTPGWCEAPADRPLPMPKFSMLRKQVREVGSRKGLALFAINEFPRYVYRLQLRPTPGSIPHAIEGVARFLAGSGAPGDFVIRAHPRNAYGWDIEARLRDAVPGARFDDNRKSFDERLAAAPLYVSNHAGTTLLEALAADVPTLVFLDPRFYRWRSAAAPFVERLRDAGIVHDDAEAAASCYRAIRDDIPGWWGSPQVRAARDAFVERYARTSEDWVEDWSVELRRLLDDL